MNPDTAELPLRDIHSASPLGWWPPAPGWWVLALLALVLTIWIGRQVWFRYRTWCLKQALKAEYVGSLSHFESNRDSNLLLADSATFLRRLLIHIGGHQSQAGVVGTAWAEFLGSLFPGDTDMHQLCNDLASSAYQKSRVEVDSDKLADLAARWIDCCVVERRARA